ncbi:MAG: preprotein translocase subunit SecG [Thermoguttaceae bacterium]
MILLILVQRGKGGGLAGAFGGMGGQSAFGARAGDTFTRITVFVAIFWFVLCIFVANQMRGTHGSLSGGFGSGNSPVSIPSTSTDTPVTPVSPVPSGSDSSSSDSNVPATPEN